MANRHWEDPDKMGFARIVIQRQRVWAPTEQAGDRAITEELEWEVLSIPKSRFMFSQIQVLPAVDDSRYLDVVLISGLYEPDYMAAAEEKAAALQADLLRDAGE